MLIEWQNDYEIGYGEFDEQHKWLINLYNRIVVALENKSASSIIMKYMSSLTHYTVFHFGAEENTLKRMGYPEFDSHKEQHQIFIKRIGACNENYAKGDHEAVHDLLSYLKSWLINHIMYEDKNYVDHIMVNNYTEKLSQRTNNPLR